MTITNERIKLKRGAQTRIAKRLNLHLSHVGRVLRGERKGGPRLMKAIEREAQKYEREQQKVA